ncbi:hypothetical protein HAX54_010078, partial [Datura stramonium]|nr:hypothetical protein [Datura stramonium]
VVEHYTAGYGIYEVGTTIWGLLELSVDGSMLVVRCDGRDFFLLLGTLGNLVYGLLATTVATLSLVGSRTWHGSSLTPYIPPPGDPFARHSHIAFFVSFRILIDTGRYMAVLDSSYSVILLLDLKL